jgi:predicted NBD/HSP70 family sugar kinase
VFIDNDVYLMALGEMRTGIAEAVDNFIFIKAGVGLGTAFISNGRAHRGANGLAGDIGHMTFDRKSSVVCRCGRLGCLEAIAGGYAVVRDARQAAESGASPALANALQTGGGLTLNDIVSIAERGDALTVALLDSAGQTLGRIVGDYVTLFNPSLVVVGGWMSEAEVLMSALRASAYESSEPRTTRDLRIVRSPSQSDLALRGALHLALDSIFTPQNLADWWGEHSE